MSAPERIYLSTRYWTWSAPAVRPADDVEYVRADLAPEPVSDSFPVYEGSRCIGRWPIPERGSEPVEPSPVSGDTHQKPIAWRCREMRGVWKTDLVTDDQSVVAEWVKERHGLYAKDWFLDPLYLRSPAPTTTPEPEQGEPLAWWLERPLPGFWVGPFRTQEETEAYMEGRASDTEYQEKRP
jgi:hypothetical protein